MYLSKRHVAENALIPQIFERLYDAGHIETLKQLPGPYSNQVNYLLIITATALSLVREATKRKINDPMTLFSDAPMPAFFGAVAHNNSSPAKREMLPTMTSYPDKAKIKYDKQMYYKSKLYLEHPIEKTLEEKAVVYELGHLSHLARALDLLRHENIAFDQAEVEAVFTSKKWSYEVPILLGAPDARHMLSYRSYNGELETANLDRAIAYENEAPQIHHDIRARIVREVNDAIANLPHLEMTGILGINFLVMPQNNNSAPGNIGMRAVVAIPVKMLDHHLRDKSDTLHTELNLSIAYADYEDYQATGHNSKVASDLDDQIKVMLKTIKSRGGIAKRRANAKKVLGDNALSIDRVAQAMIMMVAKESPKKAREIILGKTKHFHLAEAQDYVFIDKDRGNTGRVGFSFKDGKLTATFRMSSDQNWVGNGLMIPPIPMVMGESLMGQKARDVVDHAIADLLGPVKSIKTRYKRTVIGFENIYDPIDRETLLAQIPEE